MPVIYSNNASTTLSSGINNSTTTIPIASASGFPSIGSGEYYFATIANTNNTKIEVVKVTAGTTSLTVTRAQDGTSAQAFDSGDNFQLRVTAATLEAATKTDVNITAGAIAGAAITNDVIDSQHYADGSIDTAHIGDDQVTAAKLANSINTDIATGVTGNTTANAALPKSGGAMTGAITTNSTFDGRDVATDGTKLDGIEASATADQTASQIKTLLENGIDSVHYVDGSIDHVHLAADCVDGDNIGDNVINSEHYAAGSIDLEHIASQAVDEDNLYISNAGSNGQFLSKQSGNNGGLTWATVSSEDFIPNGSVMAFFQSAAPTGWTKVTSQNNKVLRVVSGNGGGTGGTWATSSGVTTSEVGAHNHSSAAHTHTGAAHTHTGASHSHGGGNFAAAAHTLSTSEIPSHRHFIGRNPVSSNNPNFGVQAAPANTGGGNSTQIYTANEGGGGSHSHGMSGNTAAATPGNGGSTTPGNGGSTTPSATGNANAHSHTISAPQYIDVIICSKDA